jgi:hypothetical protein
VPLAGSLASGEVTVDERIGIGGLALRFAATAAAVGLSNADSTAVSVAAAAGSIMIPTITVHRLLRADARAGQWWGQRIRGAFGAAIFRLAGVGLPSGKPALPAAGEPTAVALRSAVSDLFDALDPTQRAAFPQLPALLARLEQAAVASRGDASRDVADRTHTALVALELLRLALLRLHTAAGSSSDLTREIEAASRIGDAIRLGPTARGDASANAPDARATPAQ